jgi:hypothetical protein
MPEIFNEADEEPRAMPHPWAVLDARTGAVVGFAMISDNIPQPMDDDSSGRTSSGSCSSTSASSGAGTGRRRSTL